MDSGCAEPPIKPGAAGPTCVTESGWLSCSQILGPLGAELGCDCGTGPAATTELQKPRHSTITAQHARMRAQAENERLVTAKTPFDCYTSRNAGITLGNRTATREHKPAACK